MRKLTIVRHGKAAIKAEGQHEFGRDLTAEGVEQALALLGHPLLEGADGLASSSALRAKRTVVLATDWAGTVFETIPELFPDPSEPGMGRELDALYRALGEVPVGDYLRAPGAAGVLMGYAEQGVVPIRQRIAEQGLKHLVVGCHGLFSNLLAFQLLKGPVGPYAGMLFDRHLGLCQGFHMELDDDLCATRIEFVAAITHDPHRYNSIP